MPLKTTFGEDDAGHAPDEPTEDPYLFLVLETARPSAGGEAYALAGQKRVQIGRADERSAELSERELTLGVPDGWMSRSHVAIERVMDQWVFKDLGSSNGLRLNGERCQHGALHDGDVLEVGRTFFIFRAAMETRSSEAALPMRELHSLRSNLQEEYRKLARVAESALELLLLGESGTGKDVAARAVHRLSRRTGALVAVNCGAIASELLESELFGAERGAFTGATEKRIGFVRAADKGTLFLDEIGDMPAPVQVALLRVLEQREVVPVGSHRAIPVDFRLICATHRDLKAQVAAGAFRADLYARIAGFDFPLWSLRERREDLGQLIAALLPSIEGGAALTFSPEAVRAMLAHRWPLNIRELHKCLALASVLAEGARVELSHLPDDVRRAASTPAATGVSAEASAVLNGVDPGVASGNGVEAVSPRDRARRERLMALLDQHAGNVSHVARDMGKARSQVQRWLTKYGLDAIQYRR